MARKHSEATAPGQPTRHRDFTAEEEIARDAEEAAVIIADKDYADNQQYRDDRREAYPKIGDQLDMQYWDAVNGTTVWVDHCASVKAANPKPGE
jgi:hypothetical protein